MSFVEDIERTALPVRQAILAHPFITGVGDGTLPVDRFKYYVLQDYVYLIDYSRVIALASARAPDLETMSWFAELLDETLNTEMELHRSYCGEFGITREELEAIRPAPTTLGYTSYLLNVAHQGSFPELVASLLPCQCGYWEIGEHLALQGRPEGAPLYSQWIDMYVSEEFAELALWIRNFIDRESMSYNDSDKQTLEYIFRLSSEYEYRFWDAAYQMESW